MPGHRSQTDKLCAEMGKRSAKVDERRAEMEEER